MIHPTAIVDPKAELDSEVEVGPYCTIGPRVRVGKGTRFHSHVVVSGRTTIGQKNVFFPFSVIGGDPQDLKYAGEETELLIGDENTIRECVTLNRGTAQGGGFTKVGSNNLLMSYVHLGHDCVIGNDVILANNATLGGHVEVGDFAVLGGISAVHQKVRIGAGAMVGGMTGVEKDVIPYGSVIGDRARLAGLNLVGLKRRGVERDTIHAVRGCYRAIFQAGEGSLAARAEAARPQFAEVPVALEIIDFILADSARSFCTPEE